MFKVEDVERAKAFGESDDLRRVMKAAGVIGKPANILVGESWPRVGVGAGGG